VNRLTLSTLFGLTADSARPLPLPRGRGKGASAPRVRGLFAALLVLVFAPTALADDQESLEHELGFALPEPFVFWSDFDVPLYIYCNEPEGSGCPHGDEGHVDIIGRIGAPRNSGQWGSAPDLLGLLTENGWSIDQELSKAISTERRDGICRREIEYRSIRDAASIEMHMYFCESTQ